MMLEDIVAEFVSHAKQKTCRTPQVYESRVPQEKED